MVEGQFFSFFYGFAVVLVFAVPEPLEWLLVYPRLNRQKKKRKKIIRAATIAD